MYFHQRLKDMREDHDLTQKEIAAVLKITQQQYALYEQGIRSMPIKHYATLAQHYNISLDYLAGLTNTIRTLDGSPYKITKIGKIANNGKMTNNFN